MLKIDIDIRVDCISDDLAVGKVAVDMVDVTPTCKVETTEGIFDVVVADVEVLVVVIGMPVIVVAGIELLYESDMELSNVPVVCTTEKGSVNAVEF